MDNPLEMGGAGPWLWGFVCRGLHAAAKRGGGVEGEPRLSVVGGTRKDEIIAGETQAASGQTRARPPGPGVYVSASVWILSRLGCGRRVQ